jgi:hypothetical protein
MRKTEKIAKGAILEEEKTGKAVIAQDLSHGFSIPAIWSNVTPKGTSAHLSSSRKSRNFFSSNLKSGILVMMSREQA